VQVRPLVQLTGEAEFSQVFFDDVRVEHADVVGEIGNGWAVAMTTLSAERSYGLASRYAVYRSQLTRAVALLRDAPPRVRDGYAAELGMLYADLTGIRDLGLKIVSLAAAGEDVSSITSVTHMWWAGTHQRVADLGYRLAMELGRDEDYWLRLWLDSRAETIYGGTAQIQRNIIAERTLGLPR